MLAEDFALLFDLDLECFLENNRVQHRSEVGLLIGLEFVAIVAEVDGQVGYFQKGAF